MKMIVAIVPDADNEAVSKALLTQGFRVTTIASTGSFMSSGSSTLMVGVQDEQVEQVLQLVKAHCAPAPEPGLKRGSLFVLNVARFQEL
ncbi:MAG TPA: cyclic-di-AMP receptor [Anaerolineales bacterium]|nr:cyclic-di-AMP receptor [Anaerolineales bacterium]